MGKTLSRKDLLAFVFCLLAGISLSCSNVNNEEETILYNGIRIPHVWPPRRSLADTNEQLPVPWLHVKPEVIPVNVGRQLFVDDFLVSDSDMERIYHRPVYFSGNPVIEPDQEWERTPEGIPYAAPFSDGIWYDEQDAKFKMWYLTGGGIIRKRFCTAYAESADGKHWVKPFLDVVPGTSIVDTCERDAATVWLDKTERNPEKRFKLFNVEKTPGQDTWQMILKYSPDGIHWSSGVAQSGAILDRSSAFYNPFRGRWCLSLRQPSGITSRARAYVEAQEPEDVVSIAHRMRTDVNDKNVVFWFNPDSNEIRQPSFPDINPGIYHFDCIPYESIMLGQYSVWQGPENQECAKRNIQKRNEVMLGFSRDGFHFYRPDYTPFLPVCSQEDAWNWGNVQSVGGTPLIVGDSLYFYVSGRRLNNIFWDGYSSCGLATLRRDGFVSRHAGDRSAYLLTEPIVFQGKYLFVNAEVKGELRIDILSESGDLILKGPVITNVNSTKLFVMQVSRFKGRNVRLRFTMTNGDLFSFWFSPWKSGESQGYTAGGGPGLSPDGIDINTT